MVMVNLFCNALPPFVGGSVIPPRTVRPFQVGTKAKDRTVKYRQSFLFYLKFPLKKRTLSRSHFVTLCKNTIQKLLLSCIIIFLVLGNKKALQNRAFAMRKMGWGGNRKRSSGPFSHRTDRRRPSGRGDLEPWVQGTPRPVKRKKSRSFDLLYFRFKCGRWDLNPHDIAATRSLVLLVCQFRHFRISVTTRDDLYIISKVFQNVNHIFQKSKINFFYN